MEQRNEVADFIKRNTTFTPKACSLLIALSIIGCTRFLWLPFIIRFGFAYEQGPPPVIWSWLLYSTIFIAPIYLALFAIYYKSQYAPVFFCRGVVNLLPFQPILSLALIIYVLSSSREVAVSDSTNEPRRHWDWKNFWAMPLASLAIIAALVFIVYLSGPPYRFLGGGYNAGYFNYAAGSVMFFTSGIGIVLHILGTIIFAVTRRSSLALGSLLSVFLLAFVGFFGCCMSFD